MTKWLLVVGALVGVTPAFAAPCIPRGEAVDKLRQQYDEQQVGIGLDRQGQMVAEMFVSPKGTWTMLATRTNGLSCIIASGEDWSPRPKAIPPGL